MTSPRSYGYMTTSTASAPSDTAQPITKVISIAAKATRPARSSLVIRNVVVNGKRTSIRLEPEMWSSLQDICKRERCSAHDIASMVAAERGIGSLTAAMRVFIMVYYRAAATDDGHNRAGHGSGSVLQPLYDVLARQPQTRGSAY
jgi:predicted DNA-binding ribbon-helix-helix protein